MPNRPELEHLESECTLVADWVSLARRALADPADRAYAERLDGSILVCDHQTVANWQQGVGDACIRQNVPVEFGKSHSRLTFGI